MYKIEIELGWEETVTIVTDDFNKIALIQEFIALQEDCNWCEEEDEDLVFVDEEGITWVYDADLDEWVVYEAEEEEDEEDEDEEDYE